MLFLLRFQTFIIPNKKLIGYGIRDQIKDVLPSLILSLFMYIIASPVVKIGYLYLSDYFIANSISYICFYVSGSYVLKKTIHLFYIINTVNDRKIQLKNNSVEFLIIYSNNVFFLSINI